MQYNTQTIIDRGIAECVVRSIGPIFCALIIGLVDGIYVSAILESHKAPMEFAYWFIRDVIYLLIGLVFSFLLVLDYLTRKDRVYNQQLNTKQKKPKNRVYHVKK